MKTELIPLSELNDRDLGAWRDLVDQAIEPNPFFDPDFVLAAATALEETDDVALVRRADGDRWIGCMPVRRYSRWHRLPLAGLATWRHPYCLLGSPLVADGEEREAVAEMLALLHRTDRSAFTALEWTAADGPVPAAIEQAGLRSVTFESFSRAILTRRPQGNYIEGWVKGKHRREFRRSSRLLGEELGGEPELVDRSDEAAAIETFLALESSGWKGREGTALASNPRHARFLAQVGAAFAKRGAFQLLFLEADGTAIAGRCSLVAGGTDFCFKVGFDERFARFGPGRNLELKMIERFAEDERLVSLDSCTAPDNPLYNRLWRDRRDLTTVVVPAAGPLGAVASAAVRAAMAVRERRR